MSSRVKIMVCFNNLLLDFINYIIQQYSSTLTKDEYDNLLFIKSTIETVKYSNPKVILEQLSMYILPYTNEIFSKNESFFLNFEQNNLIQDTEEISRDDCILYGLQLKTKWETSDTYNKEIIWNYLIQLTNLLVQFQTM
jgi:hypothetical protein